MDDPKLQAGELAASSDSIEPVELLADDFMRRQRAGESPQIEEYCQRHPDLAGEIRDVFSALVVIEQVAPDSADLKVSRSPLESPDHQPIERVGDYRVLREVGRGGMGVVYEAEQESLGRRVALKVLPRHAAGDDRSLMRFQREARAAAKLHHTNIVPVFEVGQDNEYAFYAMQLIQGQSLDHVIDDLLDLRRQRSEATRGSNSGGRNPARCAERSIAASLASGHFKQQRLVDSDGDSAGKPEVAQHPSGHDIALTETMIQPASSTVSAVLPGHSDVSTAEDNRSAYFRSVAEIGLQCAHALSYAHARGITHRDIKPSNLLLDTAGVVWITDFGLARTTDSSLTQTGDILGTLRYMSPERFKGQCDNRADVYSLGLTLYELVALKPAFESPDRLQLIDIVNKQEVAPLRSIDARVPHDLETIILKASEKDPKRRYQSADELAEDLQRFVDDEPILARRTTTVERLARWSRRNPWLATAMSIAVLALVVVAGVSTHAAQQLREEKEVQNGLLVDQRELNEQLQAAAEFQVKTNEELELRNRTNQELIDELSLSSSRLARKQAEFSHERGNLGESMLWLARSYELASPQEDVWRSSLLHELSAAAERMPQLRNEVQLIRTRFDGVTESDSSYRQFRRQMQILRGNPSQVAAVSEDHSLIAFSSSELVNPSQHDESYHIRVWDIAKMDWVGSPIHTKYQPVCLAIHAGRRKLAVYADNNTQQRTRFLQQFRATGAPQLAPSNELNIDSEFSVWDLDTNAVVLNQEKPTDSTALNVLRQVSPSVGFRNDGQEVVVYQGRSRDPLFRVFSTSTADLIRESNIDLSSGDRFSSEDSVMSPDGRRLIVRNRRQKLNGVASAWKFALFDLESGQQVGETLSVPLNSGALPIAEDGSLVAMASNNGHSRQIEIHSFETGLRVGNTIELNVAPSSDVRVAGVSPDLSQVFVGIMHDPKRGRIVQLSQQREPATPLERVQSQTPPQHILRRFDVQSGRPVGAAVSTKGFPQVIAQPDGQTLCILDAGGIRTWDIAPSRLQPVLIPSQPGTGRGLDRAFWSLPLIPAGPGPLVRRINSLERMFNSQADQGMIMVTGANQELVLVHTNSNHDIQLSRWNRANGRLISTQQIAEAEDVRLVDISPGGRFLSTYSFDAATTSLTLQCWDTATLQRSPVSVELPARTVPLAISPDGTWLAMGEMIRVLSDPTSPRRTNGPEGAPEEALREGRRPLTQVYLLNRETGKKIPGPMYMSAPLASMGPGNGGRPRFNRLEARFSSDGSKLFVRNSTGGISWITLDLKAERMKASTLTMRSSNQAPFAVSHNGQLIAEVRDETSLHITSIVSGEEICAPFAHPAGITQASFALDGTTLVSAAGDGIIRQWQLPQPWPGETHTIVQRVREQIGIAINEESEIVTVDLSSADQPIWRSDRALANEGLSATAREALARRADSDWPAAEQLLRAWQREQPQSWLPEVLLVRPLVVQEKYDEADSLLSAAINRVGSEAVFPWIDQDFERLRAESTVDGTNSKTQQNWYLDQLAKVTTPQFYRQAVTIRLVQDAIDAYRFDDAVQIFRDRMADQPHEAYLYYSLAVQLERLQRWPEAIEIWEALRKLEPDEHFHVYRLLALYLQTQQQAEFWQTWREMRDGWLDSDTVRIPERLAKPALLFPGNRPEQEVALNLADRAYDVIDDKYQHYDVLLKGIAEYRRGHLEDAIKHLDETIALEKQLENKRGDLSAMSLFFKAMANHELGHDQQARDDYFEGQEWLDAYLQFAMDRSTFPMVDWLLCETARREAAALLNLDDQEIQPPMPDTTDWEVAFADDFERDELGEQWSPDSGDWRIESGSLCANALQELDDFRAEAVLNPIISSSSFELHYDTWWTAPCWNAVWLLNETERESSATGNGFQVEVCDRPYSAMQRRNTSGRGVVIRSLNDIGEYISGYGEDLALQPHKRYHVRILKQPQRLTAYITGQADATETEVLSVRIRLAETPNIRFAGISEEEGKVYFDNIRIRVPETK